MIINVEKFEIKMRIQNVNENVFLTNATAPWFCAHSALPAHPFGRKRADNERAAASSLSFFVSGAVFIISLENPVENEYFAKWNGTQMNSVECS